jgi:hypothetical protein
MKITFSTDLFNPVEQPQHWVLQEAVESAALETIAERSFAAVGKLPSMRPGPAALSRPPGKNSVSGMLLDSICSPERPYVNIGVST